MNDKPAPQFTLPNIDPMESRDIAGQLYATAIPRVLWSGLDASASNRPQVESS